MTTRKLMVCQIVDLGRGSFMVHPMPVKDANGRHKSVDGQHVLSSANHINKGRDGSVRNTARHPESYDYIGRA